MKKLLALLLFLIMLLPLATSCDSNNEDSSSSVQSEPDEPTYPYIDGNGYPVFRRASEPYKYINVQAREELAYNILDTILITSYDDMRTFMLQNLNQSSVSGIDEGLFLDNFVLAVYRDNNRKMKEYYCYSNLTPHKTVNNSYQLDFEYIFYLDKGYTMEIGPNTFDLVIIPTPKTEDGTSHVLSKATVGIREARHEYSLNVTISPEISDAGLDVVMNKLKISQNQYGEISFNSILTPAQSIVLETKFYQEQEQIEAFDAVFKNELICDYDTLLSRLRTYTDIAENDKITAEAFADHYVYVIAGKYANVGDFKSHNGYYTLDSEITDSGIYSDTDDIKPISISLILLPREKIHSPNDFKLYFRTISHFYKFTSANSEYNPF